MTEQLPKSQILDQEEDAGASSPDAGWSPCRVCLIILVLLHPEVANLLIG